MTPVARPDPVLDLRPMPLAAAAEELSREARAIAAPDEGSFVRLERAIDRIDLLRALRSVDGVARRYFRARSGPLEVAGFGEAAVAAPAAIEQRLGLRDAVFFVAEPFDPARARDAAWAPFAARPSVLPAIELRREGEGDRERYLLAVHLSGGAAGGDAVELLDEIAGSAAKGAASRCVVEPAYARIPDATAESAWTRAVRAGLAEIRTGRLRKIVLGRTLRFAATGPIDPVSILERLAERESRGFRFLIEAEPGRAFVGITPERLFSRLGGVVRSEAVAGTRPRGIDAAADRLMGEALLGSAKDRREQALVVERVREALAPLALRMRIDEEPRLLRLAYVQHLATRLTAELRDGVADAQILAALHPTPAVAGSPVAGAVAAIRELEPFDRGLFAGPVGIVSRAGAEIAVGIRSALVDGENLVAFAGAGIVEGSEPAEEWRETGHKLLGFERIARAQ